MERERKLVLLDKSGNLVRTIPTSEPPFPGSGMASWRKYWHQ
jgi:hypothetical protein